jgi:trypsin
MTGIQFQLRARSRCAVLAAVVVTFLGMSVQPASAIIGGQTAAPGFFGYVSFVGAVTGDAAYYCTGALVTPSVVLTAAHCAANLPATAFTVGTGRLNLYDESTGQVVGVTSVAVSPTWNPSTVRGDVALLQLAQPSTASPLPIASADDASWAYRGGTPIIVAGWGRTSPSGPPADDLHWLDMSVQKDAYCAQTFLGTNPVYDVASMFCASQPGSMAGACNGDSGAPAIAQSASGAYEIVGVTSLFFFDDCMPPDVFARVSYSSAWLSSEIALLQATASPALVPTFTSPASPLLPVPGATQSALTAPTLKTRSSSGKPGTFVKLRFWPGSGAGHLRVRLRVFNRGAVVYSKTTQYFKPTARAWFLSWRVPPRLNHSVRFCMTATLYASALSSKPSCSTLRIKRT